MSSNEFGENSTLVAKSCLQIIAEESDDEASGLSGFGVLKDRADWQNKESFGFSTDTLGKSLEGTFLESPLKAALDAPNHFDSRPKPNGKHSQIARKPAPKGDERFQKSNIKNELGNGLSTTNEASTVFWKMDLPNVHEGREATIDDDCELDTNAKSNKPLILNGTHSGDYDNAISRSWKGVGDLSIQDPGTIKPSSQSNKAPILSGGSSQTLKTTSNDSFEDIIKEKSQRRGKWFNLREIPILKNLYKDSKQVPLISRSKSFLGLLIPTSKPPVASPSPASLQKKGLPVPKDSSIDFNEEERKRFEREYTVLNQLGSGGHSTVKLATRNSDGEKVVCKFIHSSSVWHWGKSGDTERKVPAEIIVMQRINREGHPGLITYFDHFELGATFVIVMEYLGSDWVDLYDYIEMFGPIKESDSIILFKKIVEIVEFLHVDLGLCHNDIKDENVMVNIKTQQVKLIDFGSLTSLDRGQHVKTFYGTKKFCSPEALRGSYLPELQEVWALGTLFYVLLFKMDPFKTDDEVLDLDIGRRIERIRAYGINGQEISISDATLDALAKMLNKDWSQRPRVDQILKLPVFP